jgi:predicted alpha/beta-hydrolase family hydrolase
MGSTVEAISIPFSGEFSLEGYLHRPQQPCGDTLILTHGAGANCNSPLLIALAERFAASGVQLLRLNLPFRQRRPFGPPPPGSAARDQQGLRVAVEAMRKTNVARVFLGGHSYGGRQASMLAASQAGLVDGLLLLSYPLHPPKAPAQLRTAHFALLQAPGLFVSGTRDGFGTLDEMTTALKLVPARTQLVPVEGAGHELLSKKNQSVLPGTIAESFFSFFTPGI